MRKYKPGEVIEITTSQEDEDNFTISEVVVRFYGYPDRDIANLGTQSVIDSIQNLVREWDEINKGGNQPPKK